MMLNVLISFVIISNIKLASAECCPSIAHVTFDCAIFGCNSSQICYDGTTSSPYCGKGSCNMFGCNCDDGCRSNNEGTIEEAISLFELHRCWVKPDLGELGTAISRALGYNALGFKGCTRIKGFDMQIKDVYAFRFVNTSDRFDLKFDHTAKTCIANRSNMKQQGQSVSYKETHTKSTTATITNTLGISGTVKIPKVSLLDSMTIKFDHSWATSDTQTTAIEIWATAQKADVEPQSKTAILQNLYTLKTIYNYLIDFELADTSKMSTINCYAPNHINSVGNNVRGDLYEQAEAPLFDALGTLPQINVQASDGSSLERVNGKYILKNFPIKFEVSTAEFNVEIGESTKLSESELRTPTDGVTQITC